jgi:hypothetical protein
VILRPQSGWRCDRTTANAAGEFIAVAQTSPAAQNPILAKDVYLFSGCRLDRLSDVCCFSRSGTGPAATAFIGTEYFRSGFLTTAAGCEHAEQVKALQAQRLAALKRLKRSQDYLQLLELVAAQIPADVRLTEMTEHQEALTFKGEGRFYHDILSFRDVLAASGLLDKVSLADVQQQPDQMLSFVMKTRFQSARPVPEQGKAP